MSVTPDSGNTVRAEGVAVANDDFDDVSGFDDLAVRIQRARSPEDWSWILGEHLRPGNTKIAKHVLVFNTCAASDCPNLGTENCQVDADDCYAVKMENLRPNVLDFRRRQEYIWDCLDAETWAEAFLLHVHRKYSEVSTLRFNQSGDVRHRGDAIKMERIAEILADEGIDVYTYSASDYIRWPELEHLTVNQSNPYADFGHRLYTAIPDGVDPEDVDYLGDDAVQCPYDYTDGEIECGDCKLCIDQEGPDIYIRLH